MQPFKYLKMKNRHKKIGAKPTSNHHPTSVTGDVNRPSVTMRPM